MRTVVGVDSSTQATKVTVRALDDGHLVWSGSAPHPKTTPPVSEQDPEAWWSALVPLLEVALSGAGGGSPLALSVAAQQHGMVALDEAGLPVWPAKLWNDTESAPDSDALVASGGAPRWAAACGSVPGPAFTVTKLAWLRRCHPHAHRRVATVLLPHDWLIWRLTGALVTDRGDASGTGYYSPADARWQSELLDEVGLDTSVVPRLLEADETAGEHGGVVVGAGTGDNMAAALGLGLLPGDVVVSIGTSGTVFARSDLPVVDATGAVAGFADATGRFLPLVCTLNAAKVIDAVGRLIRAGPADFDAVALTAPPGSGGVVLVPYFDGERTPNLPGATGAVSGIRSDVEREQLARAAVEGVVCGILDGLDALGAAGVPTGAGRLFLVGGGARSHAVRHVLAELSERLVTVPDGDEHVARGACVQAAAATGLGMDEVAEAWGLAAGAVVEPSGTADARQIREAYRDAAEVEAARLGR